MIAPHGRAGPVKSKPQGALAGIVRDLENLKSRAGEVPGTDGVLGYLINAALVEARERQATVRARVGSA